MSDTSILLWKYHEGSNIIFNIVGKSIVFFTNMPYTHTAVCIRGKTYESSVWQEDGKWRTGIRKSNRQIGADEVMVPDKPFSTEQLDTLERVANSYTELNKPYNIFKLLILALVWPTRWLWKKLHWVPFNHEVLGEVCSGFVDEVFKRSGIDLFPLDYEGYTVPGQFTNIVGWHKGA